MTAKVTDIRYRVGFEPVAILLLMPFGGTLTLQTTQATLAARAGSEAWTDAHVIAFAQDALNDIYPDAGLVVS